MVQPILTRLWRLWRAESTKLGYPSWTAPTPWWLRWTLTREINNYGDPGSFAAWSFNTKDAEQAALDFLAGLFNAPPGWFGYITTGSSEGILYGLLTARTRHPDGVLYHSDQAHPSVGKAAEVIGWHGRRVVVPTDRGGAMDVAALAELAAARGGHPVVVATAGTTLTEAVDPVPRIRELLPAAYIHTDAAFLGLPAAARAATAGTALPFGLAVADSVSCSLHKFLGAVTPCGMVLTGSGPLPFSDRVTGYTGTTERTIPSSRNGHAPLMVWHHLHRLGTAGLLRYAEHCSTLAGYTVDRLTAAGWEAWRSGPTSATVVLKTPPEVLLRRWVLASDGGWSHVVCTPGVDRRRVDRFVRDLRAVTAQKVG